MCLSTYISMCMCLSTYISIHIHVHICMCVCVCVCAIVIHVLYVCMYIYIYNVYIRIYIYICLQNRGVCRKMAYSHGNLPVNLSCRSKPPLLLFLYSLLYHINRYRSCTVYMLLHLPEKLPSHASKKLQICKE